MYEWIGGRIGGWIGGFGRFKMSVLEYSIHQFAPQNEWR